MASWLEIHIETMTRMGVLSKEQADAAINHLQTKTPDLIPTAGESPHPMASSGFKGTSSVALWESLIDGGFFTEA
ncbi:MAG: hypothetical protein HQM09_13735, partial [Candidatus Riflebacteria bacterium]|nr:hypothetical protein [Candidatus Riflebacteria bacterium]